MYYFRLKLKFSILDRIMQPNLVDESFNARCTRLQFVIFKNLFIHFKIKTGTIFFLS